MRKATADPGRHGRVVVLVPTRVEGGTLVDRTSRRTAQIPSTRSTPRLVPGLLLLLRRAGKDSNGSR